jgi:hypothetical protein
MIPLSIVTAVSRPHNLPRIYRSMISASEACELAVRWITVVDEPGVLPANVDEALSIASAVRIQKVVFSGGPIKFGISQKNLGIDLVEDGFYHCLDDDNIVHPDFMQRISSALLSHPGKKAFVFNQQRWDGAGNLRATPELMLPCKIDNTMFVVHKSLIGDRRYDLEKAGIEDYWFFRGLFDSDPGTFVFIDEFLAYYNYIRHFPES